ncbi:MAG: hypothetical protein LBU12_08115, partial [Deltaproteobacteria bacterium]|nr:hypothetical protein [Deltaproteobacteria bacterium]
GKTVLDLAYDGRIVALFAASDEIKEDSRRAGRAAGLSEEVSKAQALGRPQAPGSFPSAPSA